MSYNISSWKTKKLNKLTIPLDAFFIHERKDWHPEKKYLHSDTPGRVRLKGGCENQIIEGTVLADLSMLITRIRMGGEGSGTFFSWILEPALKQSKGELEAVLIWEGGDSISRLKVKDGEVTHEEIEL